MTNFITYNCIEYISPWTGFKLTTLVVIGTDCIGSCKSNYHTITTTMYVHSTSGYDHINCLVDFIVFCTWQVGIVFSSTKKIDRHNITEILLVVALITINQPTIHLYVHMRKCLRYLLGVMFTGYSSFF
jgi:hypothetical protein